MVLDRAPIEAKTFGMVDQEKSASRIGKQVAIAVVVAGIALGIYYYGQQGSHETPQPAPVVSPAPRQVQSKDHYPVPEARDEKGGAGAPKLPELDVSDPTLLQQLEGLFGAGRLETFFKVDNMIRRIVVTVENGLGSQLPQEFSPLKPIPGKFRVNGKFDSLAINPANEERYAPIVQFIESIDTKRLVGIYIHFYPLFQRAYAELGTNQYFNDQLVKDIDHLLQSPEAKEPIQLIQANLSYKYKDAELETLSAGQKMMIRMGTNNRRRVKAKLQEIREQLTHLNSPQDQ